MTWDPDTIEVKIERRGRWLWQATVTATTTSGLLPGVWTTHKATRRGARRMTDALVAYLRGEADSPRAFIFPL